ncbi:MAG: ABC transporter ATP-binding protein [Erysipelotrichaceae bacterium]|nr:ABC transporter ATP-binding protein/permease [Solobacterium sp.]MDY4791716.1 ABC transporter ATP-binding protein [Erysipelotrichaceae bacterium]
MNKKSTLSKLLKELGKYRLLLLLSIILSCLTVVLTLYIPILFGATIDYIVDDGLSIGYIVGCLKYIVLLICVNSFLTWFMNIINNNITFNVVKNIRNKAMNKLSRLPLSYVDKQSSGDIVQRMIGDVDQVADGLLLGLTQLFSGIVTIVITLVFMFQKSLPITLLVIILTPLSFIVAKFIASRSYLLFGKQNKTRGQESAYIDEMITNLRLVKVFGYEDRATSRFKKINDELGDYATKATFYSSLTNPCTRAVNSLIYALVALLGAYLILNGHLTVGGLTVLLAYANQYMKPFNDISSVLTELSNALVCADRIFDLIDQESESVETEILPSAKGDVCIDNISFRYVEDKPLIDGFSLDVKSGQNIAIVGPTGCGKTTFINLLMRFYDVDKGSISVDGVDIKSVDRHSLRSNYGMVLQDSWIKKASVKENIILGKPDASEEEIIEASKKAHSYEFIKRLPNGFDTVISDDDLSVGQKQLLCITRVMLALPPMLILDEATSSIDTFTEGQIQSAFDSLMEGRTSFVVAHRLSTIYNADVILVMNDGHIIEKGNHGELMKKNGFYTKLYNAQFVKS